MQLAEFVVQAVLVEKRSVREVAKGRRGGDLNPRTRFPESTH